MKNLKTLFLSCLFLALTAHASAQKFSYSVNLGYTHVKYSFPVEKDRYHTADMQPFNATKAGASVHYSVTSSFRIHTGLEFMSVKGSKDGGDVQRSLVNPNSKGRMQFDVKNSLLILPVGFQLYLRSGKVRPLISSAMNFFKALDQNVRIEIDPQEYDPSYERVSTSIDDDTKSSYFGARLGAGVSFYPGDKHEISLLLNRHFNVSRYELSDPANGSFEKHEIRFNMWEVAIAWTFGHFK